MAVYQTARKQTIGSYQLPLTMISEIFDFGDPLVAPRSFIIPRPQQNSLQFPGLTDCLGRIERQYGFQGDAAVLVLTWATAGAYAGLGGER